MDPQLMARINAATRAAQAALGPSPDATVLQQYLFKR